MENFGGSAISTAGDIWTNERNIQQQQKNRRLMKNAAQIQVRDLRKAGLNPMLAYGKPGAPLSAAAAALTNPVSETVSTALDIKKQKEEVELLETQNERTKEEINNQRMRNEDYLRFGDSILGRQAASTARGLVWAEKHLPKSPPSDGIPGASKMQPGRTAGGRPPHQNKRPRINPPPKKAKPRKSGGRPKHN